MDKVSALGAHLIVWMKITNNIMSTYRSRTLSPKWPKPRRTRTLLSIWVRTPPDEHFDYGRTQLTIGEGQLKAKLAKLKRELLTPTGGGGGGGGECFDCDSAPGPLSR